MITTRVVEDPREIICALCRQLYEHGWVSGTGGGVSLRVDGRVYMAPSGVQKERLRPEDLFVLDEAGEVLEAPADASLRLSACAPLFFHAFRLRGAGAVLHSHSMNAMLATLLFDRELRVTHLEMMKGIEGVGYHDELVVPILENTAHECDLADAMAGALEAYPSTHAVLVRRHGVYVWGRDWAAAKTQAECYDYLFEAAVRMRQLGIDPAARPGTGLEPRRGFTH
ncbi:MAG: methylthioribulose 1-phosphate dehydratase [Sandaracinaceae bacterium]|nr:methylthioribulose 1-phosphate dehydratase [Sandaracinaceae bacterium]